MLTELMIFVDNVSLYINFIFKIIYGQRILLSFILLPHLFSY